MGCMIDGYSLRVHTPVPYSVPVTFFPALWRRGLPAQDLVVRGQVQQAIPICPMVRTF